MDLQFLATAIEPLVRRAGEYVRSAVVTATQEKTGHSDLVTEFDVNTQRMLIEGLTQIHPEANFMGEEEHLVTDVTVGDCFIIDPIDGTTNFVKGYNRSAISVAMLRNGKPALGIVYNPYTDEYYAALTGQGATYNGAPIQNKDTALHDCVVGFGACPYYPDLAKKTMRVLEQMITVAMDVRRMGSAALDICDAAMNRTGVFFEMMLSPWDYAAAGLILTEAGGVITDIDGNPVGYGNPHPIVAGSPLACKELRAIIEETK